MLQVVRVNDIGQRIIPYKFPSQKVIFFVTVCFLNKDFKERFDEIC